MSNDPIEAKQSDEIPKEVKEAMGLMMYPLLMLAGILLGTMAVGLLARKSWQIIAPAFAMVPVGLWLWHDAKNMDRKYLFYAGLLLLVMFFITFLAEDWRRIPV